MSLTLIRFSLGPHHCGLPIAEVREVLRIVAVTPLPEAPDFVEGVIDVRGRVIPVLDMRKRLGLEPGPHDSATRIVITSLRGHPAGLIVDEVSEVSEIEEADMGIDPSQSLGIDLHRYVSRVVKAGDELIVVIDSGNILSTEEGSQFDEIQGS